jgi:hypothetical protein
MEEKELISIIDAAKQLGKYKQTLFKIIRKLKITPIKHRHSQHRGQAISYITKEDIDKLTEYFSNKQTTEKTDIDSSNYDLTDIGVFYLIQLEPTHDHGRFKVGFASTMNERLRQHRCAAPFAKVIGTWPCRRLWEQTAIDCVVADCEKIHTEVFRTDNIENIKTKCINFFNLMPEIKKRKIKT